MSESSNRFFSSRARTILFALEILTHVQWPFARPRARADIYFLQPLGMISLPIIMLALLPTDHALASIATRMFSLYYGVVALLCGVIALSVESHPIGEDGVLPTAADRMRNDGYCTLGVIMWWKCNELSIYYTLIGVGAAGAAIGLWAVYLKYSDGRDMLHAMWRVEAYAEWYYAAVMTCMINVLLIARRGDWATFAESSRVKGLDMTLVLVDWEMHILFHILSGVCCVSPGARLRFQAFLSSRSETLAAAAGVSALLGKRDPKEILSLSKSLFRKVLLTSITEADIVNSKPDPDMYARSEGALLGSVDVFLSHSWHDNARAKWHTLREWREDFISKHSREPTIWLDKACINQRSIDENLACLPCFLAGCSKLLVMMGETCECETQLARACRVHCQRLESPPSYTAYTQIRAASGA